MRIGTIHLFLVSILLFSMGVSTFPESSSKVEPTAASDQEPGTEPAQEGAPAARADQESTIIPPENEVTVTASRFPTHIRSIGKTLTVISAEEIEARGARTVSQILETVPGLNVVRTGTIGSPTSVFVRGGESNFNLVLVDGVQVTQAGGSFDFAELTAANIERIEILRGPASVLYGTEAVTSTIHIITRQGKGRSSGHLAFEGGTFDSFLLRGSVQGGLRQTHYALAALYSSTDGIYDFNSQHRQGDFSGRISHDLNRSSSLEASLRFTDSEQHSPTDSSGAAVDPNDYRKTRQLVHSVVYEKQFGEAYGSRLQYGYHKYDSTSFTVQDGITDFFDSSFLLKESRHQFDWQNHFRTGKHHQLVGGLSLKNEETRVDHLNRRNVGAYVENQFSWNDRTFLTAGVRHDNNNRFANFTSGQIDLAVLLNSQLKIRGSLGNGFRAPDFSEIIGFPEFGILGNPRLHPEKNVAGDIGVDYLAANGRGVLSATAFVNRFSDLIEFTFFATPGTPNYINIEKAKSQGAEWEGFFNVTETLRLGFHYTYTRTEVVDAGSVPDGNFEKGERLLRRPTHAGDIYAQWLHNRLKLRVDFKYKGTRDDRQFFPDFSSARVLLPSYWKMDAAMTLPLYQWSESGEWLSAVLRAENLLDREYTEIAGFPSPGRSLTAGLELAF